MRWGFVSDLHWAPSPASGPGWHNEHDFGGVPSRLEAAFGWFSDCRVDVVAVGGDLAHAGDLDSMLAVLGVCRDWGGRVVIVAGNHDVFPEREGLRRAIQEIAAENVSLLGIEGHRYVGAWLAGLQVGSTDRWFGARCERLPEAGVWPDGPLVLVSHFPVLSRARLLSDSGFAYPADLLDRREIVDVLLARLAPSVVVSGHIHARDSYAEGPVLQFSQGALVEAPYECAVIELVRSSDGGLVVRRESRPLAESAVARVPVFAPPVEGWRFDASGWRLLATERAAEGPVSSSGALASRDGADASHGVLGGGEGDQSQGVLGT